MTRTILAAISAIAAVSLVGCGADETDQANGEAFASTYTPLPSEPTLITGATVLTGTGEILEDADVLMVDGLIAEVGQGLSHDGAIVVDGSGKWVTPGVIDVHSHLGVYPSPGTESHSDGNEMTSPVTAAVWAEHSVWPNDPGFTTALAGGVTSMQILPGSANLMGGAEMCMPGDNAKLDVELICPIAMDDGVRFAIREGGRTVGSGVVTKIIA